MGIRFFIFILLTLSIGFYFVPVKNLKKHNEKDDIPQVIFEKPFMYTLNEKDISRVVESLVAIRYKTRDEMFNAKITLKNENTEKNFQSEGLEANFITKKGDLYILRDNVKYKRDDFITLNTNEMYYNDKNKIAYNTKLFEGNYYKHFVKGTNVYLDANTNNIKAKDTHFEIDIEKRGNK